MTKLFLDTNIYLDFYRSKSVTKLLKPLLEVKAHILVPKQVVNEVQRNKVALSKAMLEDDLKNFKFNLILPDILLPMEKRHKFVLQNRFRELLSNKKIVVLNIPDRFEFMDSNLISILKKKMKPYL